MKSKDPLRHYLQHYAAEESRAVKTLAVSFQQALIIPIYREHIAQGHRFLQQVMSWRDCLLILVINSPPNDDDQWAEDWLQLITPEWQAANLQFQSLPGNTGMLLVNRLGHSEYGVGNARKAGNDIACALYQNGALSSCWLANTDADAELPDDYLDTLRQSNADDTAALVFPYRHITDDPTSALYQATRLYEFSLAYYVAGLGFAGSPYAYQTLGSILAVSLQHYSRVRGFPKRLAGEDFYLLNKLAKTGRIVSLTAPTIAIQSRLSDRVPFGTGPAIERQLDTHHPKPLTFYQPSSFLLLQQVLQHMSAQLSDGGTSTDIPPQLPAALEFLQADKILRHCRQQGKIPAQRIQQLHQHLDAFKTLKLIHWWHQQYGDKLSLTELQQQPLSAVIFQQPELAEFAEFTTPLNVSE